MEVLEASDLVLKMINLIIRYKKSGSSTIGQYWLENKIKVVKSK